MLKARNKKITAKQTIFIIDIFKKKLWNSMHGPEMSQVFG